MSWKVRKSIANALRTIYAAPASEAVEQALGAFAERWDRRFPSIRKSWRENWQRGRVVGIRDMLAITT